MSKKAPSAIERVQATSYVWVSDFVYGGIDGAVTTFAVVAGVEGARLQTVVIIVLGFANLVADGFSMAVSKYSSDKAELERIERLRREEIERHKRHDEAQHEEVRAVLERQGFEGKCLVCAETIVTKNQDVYVDLVMRYKHGVVDEAIFPQRSAAVTFAAFIMIGLIPLLAYLFQPLLQISDQNTFYITSLFTLVALFVVGAVKARFTDKNWFISGVGTAILGGSAAAISYIIGFVIHGIVG